MQTSDWAPDWIIYHTVFRRPGASEYELYLYHRLLNNHIKGRIWGSSVRGSACKNMKWAVQMKEISIYENLNHKWAQSCRQAMYPAGRFSTFPLAQFGRVGGSDRWAVRRSVNLHILHPSHWQCWVQKLARKGHWQPWNLTDTLTMQMKLNHIVGMS